MEIADYIIADDRVLVELVLQGDNIAFEYLFERYKEAIHRLFIPVSYTHLTLPTILLV